MRIEDLPWKSSVLRCFDSTDCDCMTCRFISGYREQETLMHVIALLDSKLAESEKAERSLTHALFKLKEERDAML